MSETSTTKRSLTLSRFLDHFIPAEMQVNMELHRRARMFMLSHVFGPILGSSLPIYLAVTGISRDYRVVVFLGLVLAFWIYPFILRWTGRYQIIAFASVQNLIFAGLWACYAYGGLNSPFLPWILIFPLLAFLYLPTQGWVRNLALLQIFGNIAVFFLAFVPGNRFPAIDLSQLQVIGMISMASVAIYFAMMSLYFAKMFREQQIFTRELSGLVSTSDNIQNLTDAANQASAAKALFVASMSHELRTPLNAIIGYSQLLLEEAVDEHDDVSVNDLEHIHHAGTLLLRLIDDILDYSRIEAGKMPVNIVADQAGRQMQPVFADLQTIAAEHRCSLTIDSRIAPRHIMRTDWNAVRATLRHLTTSIASSAVDGSIELAVAASPENGLEITIVQRDATGIAMEAYATEESFDHRDDASATKYGRVGIDSALAAKFVGLVGGEITAMNLGGGPQVQIVFPDLDQSPLAIAA